MEKGSSLTGKVSSICVWHANHFADLDEITAVVKRMKEDIETLLSNVSTEVQMTYSDLVEALKQRTQEDLVNGWKKIKMHFHV